MTRIALRNPYLVIVASLAVLTLGILSYTGVPFAGIEPIPRDLLPIFKTPAVQIVTFYPGMPPVVMERDIMSRLERWTGQSVGIEHQEAKAMLGVCIVKDFFREDISMDTAMSQVTSYAMSDMFYLPPGTIPPMVMPFDPTASVPLCLVSVSNPQMNEKELYDIAYFQLRNELQSIRGVIAPAVYGGKLRRILCYVDREKLEARGLSLVDVQQALLKQNVLIPAGNAKMGDYDFQIFTNAIPDSVDKLNDAPIKVVNGAPVLIRDVGEVQDAGQIQSNIVRINGARQVYIPIYRQPGANTIKIVDSINKQLADILARLKDMYADNPKMKTLDLRVVMDQSKGVRQSITGLKVAAGLGAALAGLVVFVFLGGGVRRVALILLLAIPLSILVAFIGLFFTGNTDIAMLLGGLASIGVLFVLGGRAAVIVLLAIPLSMLAAFIGLFYTGDTINAMTLGGLALAVGILVDQSIVVLENVVRHARMGKTSFDAALDGTREVAMPILVATITFCIVFYPVVFLSGLAKFLFTPLAIAASLAILASYLIAITLVPAYCARFLRVEAIGGHGPHGGGNEPTAAWARWYGGLLKQVLKFRFVVVAGALALFAGSMVLLAGMGQELFPAVDAGQFTIYARLKSGTRIERSEEAIGRIEQLLIEELGAPDPGQTDSDSDLQMLISNIGVLMDWPAAYTPNTGSMDAFLLVQLKDSRGRESVFLLVEDLRRKLNERFPDVEFAFDTGGMMTAALNMGEPSPIHFQVTGSNLQTAQEIAGHIKREAEQVSGVADVRIAQRMDYPILQIEIDRVLAAYQGVSVEDVMKNVVSATNSSINFEPAFWIDPKNGNHYFLGVQYPEEDIESLDTIRNVPITGSGSTRPTLLRNLANIETATGAAVINHRNIKRATDIYANVLPGRDVGSLVAAIERRIEANRDLAVAATRDERGSFFKVGSAPGVAADHPYKDKGYRVTMQGEMKSMRQSFALFAAGLAIASVLVYLVMVAQFRSFLDPFVILLTVPLGFIGVVLLLYVTGTHLSIMSLMGMIMMVGIVVEYSIVLIDFANHRVEEGLAPREAILDAATVRLRPILMTSLTTLLALLPMAWPGVFLAPLGLSGGEANIPLARTIIGGVAGATVLSLLVVPCLYVMMKRTLPRPGRETVVEAAPAK